MEDKQGLNMAALAALLKGDMANASIAMTPDGIERQEKQGQLTFARGDYLPKEMQGDCRAVCEAWGIVFGREVDDLFIEAKLPAGWQKVPTDHSMWVDVVDEKGRKRLSVFYKAAFYDRSAHMSCCWRFSYSKDYSDGQDYRNSSRFVVRDGQTVIFTTDTLSCVGDDEDRDWQIDWQIAERVDTELGAKAEAWLNEHYPDWQSPLAYWD